MIKLLTTILILSTMSSIASDPKPDVIQYSERDTKLLDYINSGCVYKLKYANKCIYKGRFDSMDVLDASRDILMANYQKRYLGSRYEYLEDALAWGIKAVWRNGNSNYTKDINEVAKHSSSRKLRKYARKYHL